MSAGATLRAEFIAAARLVNNNWAGSGVAILNSA